MRVLRHPQQRRSEIRIVAIAKEEKLVVVDERAGGSGVRLAFVVLAARDGGDCEDDGAMKPRAAKRKAIVIAKGHVPASAITAARCVPTANRQRERRDWIAATRCGRQGETPTVRSRAPY